jgi:hypothetical protein
MVSLVNEKQFDVRLSAFGPGTSSEHYMTETARKLDEDYCKHVKIYTDGSKMGDKVGYAKKNTRSRKESYLKKQCSVRSSLQILEQSEKNIRHEIMITMDFLSTIMAAESRKTQLIRKMLDQKGTRITLVWVPSHKQIPGNEKANQAADLSTTEKYPPDDLK